MLTERETVMGLRLLLGNACLRVQGLLDAMQVGADVRDQADAALKACDLAALAIAESEPTLRKLARPTKLNLGGT